MTLAQKKAEIESHCEHIYCGICLNKGRKEAISEFKEKLKERLMQKLYKRSFNFPSAIFEIIEKTAQEIK